ncbi:MAG TPA: BT_3928 family protein [Ohtaekwangia sp.]|nr:BT_3928 family protein [Ohtaekwangia sp.]
MKKIVDQVARFIVGGLFIFSGLIKLNDPVGTEIKMEEYFEVFAEDFGSFFLFFKDFAMEIGMIMIVLEVVLGVAVLIYYRMNITAVILLVLLTFFTFLTFYSAYFNKVTDCGCFGDAIKLTPWESFFKDVFLMVWVLHLFWYRKTYKQLLPEKAGHAVIFAITVLSTAAGIYAIQHLPFIDFRAYKIGNHIPTQMKPAEQAKFEYIFERKDNGEEIRSEKYLTDTTLYKYKSINQTNADSPDTKAKITDYAVFSTEGEDMTQQTFEGIKLFFIVYNVEKASTENIASIKELIDALDGKIDMMLLTASGGTETEAFRHEHQLAIPYYFADATVLKTIVRSNPGITLWVDGTVKDMWHHNDTPTPIEVLASTK